MSDESWRDERARGCEMNDPPLGGAVSDDDTAVAPETLVESEVSALE